MTFADKLKQVRGQLFLSQEALGEKLGVTGVTVNRWETGKHEPNYKAQKAFHDLCVKNKIRFEDN